VELLRHLDAEGLTAKNRSGYDALHVAAREGRHGELLSCYPLERSVTIRVSV
jgi:hypothetical protein